MSDRIESARRLMARGPATARQVADLLGISQATVSRLIAALNPELLRIRRGRSIHYVLRDGSRGFGDIPVFRVNEAGQIQGLGQLVPVYRDAFVMVPGDGSPPVFSEGLPWWLFDMRPAGFLGRAYAAQHGAALGLPPRLSDWSDTDVLRALLAHGHDAVGNLLLGEAARERFLQAPAPVAIATAARGATYARLAAEAARGEAPGTSAGGEQPKFAACVESLAGPTQVLVKFTASRQDPVTARWADLLLAEHHAMSVLRDAGVPAARTEILDEGDQRFLQIERFDRQGPRGRRALLSLLALDAEFLGQVPAPWPSLVQRLAAQGVVQPEAIEAAALLHAYGELIGNTDMHAGNLSFVGPGRPYVLAPAYDMLPMGLAPQAGGLLPEVLRPPQLRAEVPTALWTRALGLADELIRRMRTERRGSAGWAGCVQALEAHRARAASMLARLA